MKRLLAVLIMVAMLATWTFAAVEIQEWTYTYFKSNCPVECLAWMGDADSAKVHFLAVRRDGTLTVAVDTTLFGPQ